MSETTACSFVFSAEDPWSIEELETLWSGQGHYNIDRLEERGVERGSARRSSLKGRERFIINQTNTGLVSKATLGELQSERRDGARNYGLF